MSEGALLDAAWFRVASLTPRLRAHVRVHRHRYRGDVWYVMQDGTTGRFHRFTPVAHQIIGLMDGVRTVDQIWSRACEQLGDDAPTQSETMRLLYQLHSADALQCDVPPDADEMLRRYERHTRARWLQQLKSPLAIRIPLFDPERLLNAMLPLVRPLLSTAGALLWLLVVATAVVLAGIHWPDLTRNVSERVLSPENLVVIWLAFPVVKALHELGHGLAVKRWGGEVHQMGIMLLVLAPVPYVDASASSAFANKYRRAAVGAAGMIVELFLAALAMLVWVSVEPGLTRTIAYNVMFIAGVSTLLFNGNPLLRFDAYYILADLLEIPNLANRSNQFLQYLAKRHLLGAEHVHSPVSARGETGWFVFYALASFAYRLFIYIVIVTFIASKFFVIGVLLAIWASFSTLLLPLLKAVKYLLTHSEVRRRRRRALTVSGALLGLLLAVVLAVPLPLATMAEGVVWIPEDAIVRVGASGTVVSLHVASGDRIDAGGLVATLADPYLPAQVAAHRHELEALEARRSFFMRSDVVQAQITLEEIVSVKAALARASEQSTALTVRSATAGRVVLPRASDVPGRFLRQGEQIGYVVGERGLTVRAVVEQHEIDLVRSRIEAVAVRLVDTFDRVHEAALLRISPSATSQLASPALGAEGGGRIALDPSAGKADRAYDDVFHVDLSLPESNPATRLGSRVYVRFDHGVEPLAARWYRALRRLLLSHFDV